MHYLTRTKHNCTSTPCILTGTHRLLFTNKGRSAVPSASQSQMSTPRPVTTVNSLWHFLYHDDQTDTLTLSIQVLKFVANATVNTLIKAVRYSRQWAVGSRQWAVGSGQWALETVSRRIQNRSATHVYIATHRLINSAVTGRTALTGRPATSVL